MQLLFLCNHCPDFIVLVYVGTLWYDKKKTGWRNTMSCKKCDLNEKDIKKENADLSSDALSDVSGGRTFDTTQEEVLMKDEKKTFLKDDNGRFLKDDNGNAMYLEDGRLRKGDDGGVFLKEDK